MGFRRAGFFSAGQGLTNSLRHFFALFFPERYFNFYEDHDCLQHPSGKEDWWPEGRRSVIVARSFPPGTGVNSFGPESVKLPPMSRKKIKQLRIPFHVASRLTDLMPVTGARLLDRLLFATAGSRRLTRFFHRQDLHRVRRVKQFGCILVISDLNIGDAVNMQAGIAALREYFPEATIDYMVNRAAARLIEGNPDITTLYPLFTRAPIPEMSDVRNLDQLCAERDYDLIINYSPFFKRKQLATERRRVLDYRLLAATLVHNEQDPEVINHVVWQAYYYVHRLFSTLRNPAVLRPFSGTSVTLSPHAVQEAMDFLYGHDLLTGEPLILYNPEASSRFTRIPVASQVELLRRLLHLDVRLLLGAGQKIPDLHRRLLAQLPVRLRRRLVVVPATLPFDAYAALIDRCDVFVSGDSGPLHVGAARKRIRNGDYRFRNRTAVFGVFGATPARIYGYDSLAPGFMPANQDAPARTYVADSPCRNITCINKRAKICKQVRCFQRVPAERIGRDIGYYLKMKTLRSTSER